KDITIARGDRGEERTVELRSPGTIGQARNARSGRTREVRMRFATLAEIVRHQAATQPERVALTFENRDTSYAALDRRASQMANGLIAAGLHPASREALLDKNHDGFFVIWFGAAKATAVLCQ